MTAVSPHWATWSLQSIMTEPKAASARHRPAGESHEEAGPSTPSIENGRLALFSESLKDNVYDSQWQDLDQDDVQESALPDMILDGRMKDEQSVKEGGIIDVEALFEQVKSMTKDESKEYEGMHSSIKYRYDPLTSLESRYLFRALKLSKYIPPSAQELEQEKKVLLSAKIEPAYRISVDEPKDKRRTGHRINLETGKRIYSAGTRGTGLIQKENEMNKEILRTMCKQMLPRRNFDWILAQLTYKITIMLGSDEEIPSARTLIRDEAIKSIKNESLPMEEYAHVIALLAEASRVDTTKYEIIDPTKKARSKGRSLGYVKNQMLAQSKAVFDILRFKLFPEMFDETKCQIDPKPIKIGKDDSTHEYQADTPQTAGTIVMRTDKTVSATPEVGPSDVKPSWQSIFPQMSKKSDREETMPSITLDDMARKEEEKNCQEISSAVTDNEGASSLKEEGAKQPTSTSSALKRGAESIEMEAGAKRKKRELSPIKIKTVTHALAAIEQPNEDLNHTRGEGASVTKLPLSSLKTSVERLSRSSSSSECGDFKLPLPPFWAKNKVKK